MVYFPEIECINSSNPANSTINKWIKQASGDIQNNTKLSKKMKEYLVAQLENIKVDSPTSILLWRAKIISYLDDVWDVMGDPIFDVDECDDAVAYFYPKSFKQNRQCIYCLKIYNDNDELQVHINDNCNILSIIDQATP
ncbi:MAG: hypothetical protein ISR65_13990 [Bacteriovoracaceae bacterium]|nr:hypothetical protein [Bacteriovoracaceae bacterium]